MPSTPPQKKILVLSDIHFGSLSASADFCLPDLQPKGLMSNARPMKQSLIEAVKDESIDCILVPGDLTSTARPSEFKGCYDVIKEIAKEIGVQENRIIHTYGNHDADWMVSKLNSNEPCDSYLRLSSETGGILVPGPQPSESGPVLGCGLHKLNGLRIISLNSGYFCTSDQEYPHGKLGEKQLEWFKKITEEDWEPEKNWIVLMVHHHPRKYSYPTTSVDISHIEEGAELEDLVAKSDIDLICHGHRHQPKIFTHVQTGWKSPKTFVCAGSVAVDASHRSNGEFPNMFHVVEFLKRDSDERYAIGSVHSFAYTSHEGWSPHKYSNAVPIDYIQAFGPAVTQNELEASADRVFDMAIDGSSSFTELPKHSDLPIELRCIPCEELNLLIDQAAKRKDGIESLVGRYPQITGFKREIK